MRGSAYQAEPLVRYGCPPMADSKRKKLLAIASLPVAAALAFVVVGFTSLVPSPYLPPAWTPDVLLRLAQALPGVEGWSALYTWRAAADLLLGWGLFLSVRRVFAGDLRGRVPM